MYLVDTSIWIDVFNDSEKQTSKKFKNTNRS
jgi:predicted nucleic acid-binding protein